MGNQYFKTRYLDRDAGWRAEARCRGMDTDIFFAWPRHDPEALAVCARCPVSLECLEEAMAFEGSDPRYFRAGVWGGMTASQRARLAKERR